VNAAAPREAWRRAVHLASGSLGLAPMMGLPRHVTSIMLLSLVAAALVLEGLRRRRPRLEQALETLAFGALRPAERRGITGGTLLAVGYAAAWLLWPAQAAAPAIVVAAVADPAAAAVGIAVAGSRGRKTWAGTAAAGVAALLVLLALGRGWSSAAGGALAAALLERVPGRGLDNIALPVGTAAVLALIP
jgi:dolichol kinase